MSQESSPGPVVVRRAGSSEAEQIVRFHLEIHLYKRWTSWEPYRGYAMTGSGGDWGSDIPLRKVSTA